MEETEMDGKRFRLTLSATYGKSDQNQGVRKLAQDACTINSNQRLRIQESEVRMKQNQRIQKSGARSQKETSESQKPRVQECNEL